MQHLNKVTDKGWTICSVPAGDCFENKLGKKHGTFPEKTDADGKCNGDAKHNF